MAAMISDNSPDNFDNDFDDDIPQMLSNLSKDAGGASADPPSSTTTKPTETSSNPATSVPSSSTSNLKKSNDNAIVKSDGSASSGSSDDDADSETITTPKVKESARSKTRAPRSRIGTPSAGNAASAARWERNQPRSSTPSTPTTTSATTGALSAVPASVVAQVATPGSPQLSVPPSPATQALNGHLTSSSATLQPGNTTGGIGWFNLKAPEWQTLSTFAWIPKKRGETLPSALGQHLKALKALAQEEDWGDHDYVLINYLVHTFYHAQKQGKLVSFEHKEQGGLWYCFNTGLITPNFQSIYAFFMPNRQDNGLILKDYLQRYHAVKRLFPLPKRVRYYNTITDLIFDRSKRLVVDYDHIIADNWARLSTVLFPNEEPTETQTEKNVHQTRILLKGAVKDAKRRCESNYRTAVPQMYGDKLQLLLPLCFANKTKADLALTVARKDFNPPIAEDYYYEAVTVLDMRMAYNNARLIAKPERDWLIHPDTPATADVSSSITSSAVSGGLPVAPASPAVGSPLILAPQYHVNRRNSIAVAPASSSTSSGASAPPPGLGSSGGNNAPASAGATLARPPPGFATPSFRQSPLAAHLLRTQAPAPSAASSGVASPLSSSAERPPLSLVASTPVAAGPSESV